MTIEKKIKNRIMYSALLIVVGIVAVIIGSGAIPIQIPEYNIGFYAGAGTGLIFGCVVMIIKNVRLLKNAEKLKAREIYENDERVKMIGAKTWSYTGYAMYIVLMLGILVAPFISEAVLNTVSVITGVYACCLIGASIYCNKTM